MPREFSQSHRAAHHHAVCRDGLATHSHPAESDGIHFADAAAVPVIGYFLNRTPAGVAVRMVGENPQAAEGAGGVCVLAAGQGPGWRAAVCLLRRAAIAPATIGGRRAALPDIPDAAYVLSIVALILVARKASYPQALMKPYRKGER